MRELEIARRLSELNQPKDACKAYKLVLELNDGKDPELDMECAAHILQYGSGEDYKISYTIFRDLYNRGIMKNSILSIMQAAFYEPNIKQVKSRYERNCKLLTKYPYIFRKDFLKFEELPIQFFPYDDNSYTPFYPDEERFGDYIDFKNPVISRNFFKDLDNPILADDVYSQYELEYLRDNVRKSEYIGRENHVYLHYTNWGEFCSYLQCLNIKLLLEEKKLVFLIEDEVRQYPIDFKERFGIDYSQYSVRPIGIREVQRIIWHTQLSSHNGGDFFNEIFDNHPNLLALPSIMFDSAENTAKQIVDAVRHTGSAKEAAQVFANWNDSRLVDDLYRLRDCTLKDALVALYMREKERTAPHLDENSRIAPALFFQPHFYNIVYEAHCDDKGQAVLHSAQYEAVRTSPLFRDFKYIKTFTPMRRFTTSHGATVKFMYVYSNVERDDGKISVVDDTPLERVLNRSFMIDWQDRLFKDSILVRFEDGKLNPRATFTALAAFLDLPYTESMTYGSEYGEKDYQDNVSEEDKKTLEKLHEKRIVGFNTETVYRTYDDYVCDDERRFIEYFLRDAYQYYGYDPIWYDGKPVDEETVEGWIQNFDKINYYMRDTWIKMFRETSEIKFQKDNLEEDVREALLEESAKQMLEQYMRSTDVNRIHVAKLLRASPRFVNRNGQPLKFMPKLELDPALLEQPLYH